MYGGYTALEHVQKEEAGEEVGSGAVAADDSDDDSAMDEVEVHDDDDDDDEEEDEEEDEESEGEEEAKDGEQRGAKAKAKAKAKRAKDGKAKAKKGEVVSDEYLAPEQVEATLQLLWRYHPEVLDAVHGRAQRGLAAMEAPSAEGWRVFFLRAILVPANRFRPEAIVGDTSSDHPQNLNLAKIIETNQAIRQVHRQQRVLAAGGDAAGDHEGGGEGMGGGEGAAAPSLADLVGQSSSGASDGLAPAVPGAGAAAAGAAAAAAAAAAKKDGASLLSKSLSLLIQLQNHVNCYMDSSKDPNPLGGSQVQPGIRQILERKEGLFRKNMMGKRVNYCCRSVISPDPYIGTNEVGIPLHFAKSLHYPEPVNEYNVKRLRTLVERGPFHYPGTCP
jgi:DNA-directed RNA polymerase I subunit RPA1